MLIGTAVLFSYSASIWVISSSFPEIISLAKPSHFGQRKDELSTSKSVLQFAHRTRAGTTSISNAAPSATVLFEITSKEKLRASGTMAERVPIRTHTLVTRVTPCFLLSSWTILSRLWAMESSCMIVIIGSSSLGSRCGHAGCHNRLAKRDASIIAGDKGMGKDVEAFFFQGFFQAGQ